MIKGVPDSEDGSNKRKAYIPYHLILYRNHFGVSDTMTSEHSQSMHGVSYFGTVNTTEEAMRLVFAARIHLIPRITRRLTDRERVELIRSGNVFIFDVEETGIHRWTDGRAWNDSRILGNFLIYRQLMDRTGARRRSRASSTVTSPSSNLFSITPTSIDTNDSPAFEHPRLMPGGLSKKTITVKFADSISVHLIAYFTTQDVDSGRLPTLAQSRQSLLELNIRPDIFNFAPFRYEPETYWDKDGRRLFKFDRERLGETTTLSINRDEGNDSTMLSSNASLRQLDANQESTSTPSYAPSPVPVPPSSHVDSYRLAEIYDQPGERRMLPSLSISRATYAFSQRQPSSASTLPPILGYPSRSASEVHEDATAVNGIWRGGISAPIRDVNNISSCDYSLTHDQASASAAPGHPSSLPLSFTSTERMMASQAGELPSAITSSRAPGWNPLNPWSQPRPSTHPQAEEPSQSRAIRWSGANTSIHDGVTSLPMRATYNFTSFPPSSSS